MIDTRKGGEEAGVALHETGKKEEVGVALHEKGIGEEADPRTGGVDLEAQRGAAQKNMIEKPLMFQEWIELMALLHQYMDNLNSMPRQGMDNLTLCLQETTVNRNTVKVPLDMEGKCNQSSFQ